MRSFSSVAVPCPPKPERLWDPSKPLDLELGCGAGWHAIRSALQNVDREYIAIEHAELRFSKFMGRYERHFRPDNLYPVRAHAVYWVHHYLPEASVDQIYLLYPNPYPKASQRNKRWHEMPFFPDLIRRLKLGGRITLATNESFYAEGFAAVCQELGLANCENLKFSSENQPSWAPRTHFEKKFLGLGATCYNLVFERPNASIC